MNSSEILERQFLEMRARILELAASLDRIDRAEGDVSDQQSMINIRKGIEVLADTAADRARRVQLLFSRDYHENWAAEFEKGDRSN